MYPDFKELLCAFNAHNVRYLIVGGYAVSIHAQPRATKDLDILIDPSKENKDFTEPENFFRMGTPPANLTVGMADLFK